MKPKFSFIVFIIVVLIWAVQAGIGFAGQKTAQKETQAGSWQKMVEAAPIQARSLIGTVLIGNKLVVWGGEIKDNPVSDGAVYDIDRDSWKKMSKAPIEGREHFTILAYGKKVIIWGGENTPYGAIYDIDKDAWAKMAEAPITLGAEPYTSGVLGNKVLVWGIGKTRELNPVGGIYDVAQNAWIKMAEAPIQAIDDWPPFFNKNRFIIWGAPNVGKPENCGAIYDIDKNSWKEMSKAPIKRRNWSASILLGNKLIIWGGCPGPVEADSRESQSDGAIYDIDKNTWKKMADAPLEARFFPRAFVWNNKVVIWGGMKDKFYYDGAIYTIETDTWEKITEAPLKSEHARELYSYGLFGYNPTPQGLLGNKLLVWSMYCSASYDLGKKKWEEMTEAPISGRDYHTVILYGNKLIIWGGRDDKNVYADGAIYEIRK
jgi:hypothetical protein